VIFFKLQLQLQLILFFSYFN